MADTKQDEPQESGEKTSQKVSLAQYAAVKAALAEGFPLEEVLEVEGIPTRRFQQADIKWKERLASAERAKEPLFDKYREQLAIAEDGLARRVEPVDTDVAAWAAFLNALATATDTGALLFGWKLGPNDISRLTRRWAKRAAEEPAIAKQIEDLRKKGQGKVPPLNVAPAALRRSAAADAAGTPRKQARSAALGGGPDIVSGVSGAAAAARPPEPAPVELPTFLREQGSLMQPAADGSSSESGSAVAPVAPSPPAAVRKPDAGGTMDVSALLSGSGPALPFAEHASQAAAQAFLEKAAAEKPVSSKPKGATVAVPIVSAVPGAALPFAHDHDHEPSPPTAPLPVSAPVDRAPAARPAPVPPPVDKAPAAKPPSGAAGATQDVSDLLAAGPALPFAHDASRPPPSPRQSQVPPLAGSALPFGHHEASQPPPPPRQSAVPPIPGQPSAFASPVPAPVAGSRPVSSSSPPIPAPVAGSRPVSSSSPPVMPLEQYACLCVELHLHPERVTEIYQRYRLTHAEKAPLDAHWQQRMAREPALHAVYSQTYTAYHARFSALVHGTPVHASPVQAAPAARPALPSFSVQQWASLTVDLSNDPARRVETLRRYGLGEPQKAELDAQWGARLSANPALRAELDRAMAQYRVWLTARQR
jgi:hypothetical protein